MRNIMLLILSEFMFLSLSIGCANTKLNEYKAASTEEEKIIQVMDRAQDAWNAQDESGFIAEFCSNGEYSYRILSSNRGNKKSVSKDDISSIFSNAQDSMGPYDLVNPKFSIHGDKTDLTADNAANPSRWHNMVLLVRESGIWCINDWDFNFSF